MEEGTEQTAFEEFIATRLIHQADDFVDDELQDDEVKKTTTKRRADISDPEVRVVEVLPPEPADATSEQRLTTKTDAVISTRIDVKVEKSLMSLGFFTPSSRRVKKEVKRINFIRTVDGKKVEASAEFHPSPAFGLPITADQDKFLALHHIIAERLRTNGRVQNPIRFTTPELCRLLNIKNHGGRNYAEIVEWLDVMSTTTIISNGVIYEKDKESFVHSRDRFHVFERARTVGQTMPDGSIADANYVWLSDWQLSNINEKYLVPVDLEAYRELKTRIAKALVPLLQIWLFASQSRGSFEKKYDELCEMLNLKVHSAPSLIKQQLSPAFEELVKFEYLSDWRIERTVDKRSYKIIFVHGTKFQRDRKRALEEKARVEEVVVVAESESSPELPIPGRLEDEGETDLVQKPRSRKGRRTAPADKRHLDVQTSTSLNNREALEAKLVDELSARGLMPSSAMKLLKTVPTERLEDVGDYIDYWDETKKTKEVGAGFLHSLIKDGQPLPSNFETRRKREERLAAQNRERDMYRLKQEIDARYREHCERLIDRFIAEELPAGEFDRRVVERQAELIRQGGFWDGPKREEITASMARHEIRAEIGSGVTVSYQDFYRRELPSALARLGLDSAEWIHTT